MTTLIRNNSTVPECDTTNKALLEDRGEVEADITKIRGEILDFHSVISSSSHPKIAGLKKATSFPVDDISRMFLANPDCKFLRVYNGFDAATGKYVTYLTVIKENFEFYPEEVPTIISQTCCQCNPCTKDRILHP